MTEAHWRAPSGAAVMAGAVVYRCAECGERIEAPEVAFTEAGTPAAQAWHPDHAPAGASLRPRILEPVIHSGG